MDLLSVSKIFGGISNPVKLFKIIFNEETIPELYSFYSHWEGENALDSQSRAIRRMVISPPKSLTQKYQKLAEILNDTDTFLHLCSHTDTFLCEYSGSDLSEMLYQITNHIRCELTDDSCFSTTLLLLYQNLEKPYAKAKLLTWCIIYFLFRQFHILFLHLYDITNPDSYNGLYENIITGQELIQNYSIYKKNDKRPTLNNSPASKENITSENNPDYRNEQHQLFCTSAIEIPRNRNFIGRERELTELEQSLNHYNKVFVQGIGGIGKSEFVKEYAVRHKTYYNTILLLTYENSLKELILNERQIYFENFFRISNSTGKNETDEMYFHRKLEKIKYLFDEKTLLILDNFNAEYDPDLESFLSGRYAVIITTRNHFDYLGLPVCNLKQMEPKTEQLTLFRHYYKKPLTDKETEQIFTLMQKINGHTYAIELIAKLMFSKRISPLKMIQILEQDGISPKLKGNVHHSFEQPSTVYENIKKLFVIDQLTKQELDILIDLSFIPIDGFPLEEFAELCGLEDCEAITQLYERSWIQFDDTNDLIYLHPLIAEIITNECNITPEKCKVFLENFSEKIHDSWNMLQFDKIRYAEVAIKIYRKFPQMHFKCIELSHGIARLLICVEQFETSRTILSECLTFVQKTHGEYSKETAEFYYDMADCELYSGNLSQSLIYIKNAVDVMHKVDPNAIETAYYLKFEAWILLSNMTVGDDMTYIKDILNECSQVLHSHIPENHSQIGSLYSALAYTFFYSGQLENALEYANKSYDIYHALYGEMNADTLSPMGIQALILAAMDKTKDAIILTKRIIEIQKAMFSESHITVLRRKELLAKVYVYAGMIPEAKECLNDIISVLKSQGNTQHNFYHQTLSMMNQLLQSDSI